MVHHGARDLALGPSLATTSCMSLDMLLNLFEPHFLILKMGLCYNAPEPQWGLSKSPEQKAKEVSKSKPVLLQTKIQGH